MNQDNRKRNATKHYQNSDYPSGSFEAAIQADHEARLRESSGLRLERHPAAEVHPREDLEEMVPAFMHRDFFRSEDDAVDAVKPATRLRGARRESSPQPPVPAAAPSSGAPAASQSLSSDAASSVTSSATASSIPTPTASHAARSPASGYVEPPQTEDDSLAVPPRPSQPTAAEPSPYARPSQPTAVEPSPYARPAQEGSTGAPSASIAPLRSSEAPPAAEVRPPAEPLRGSTPLTSAARPPSGAADSPAPTAGAAPAPAPAVSPYSIPLLVALAMVLAVFVWREQTRPVLVVQTPMPIPKTARSPVAAAPTPVAPAVAPAAFRPTYMAVGPAVPQDVAASASPSPASGEEQIAGQQASDSLDPAATGGDSEADERAAILDRMSQASAAAAADPASQESSGDDQGDSLFPADDEAAAAPAPPVRPKPAAKPVATTPAAKPQPVAASAADLFPIDEELPIRPAAARPAATARPAPAASVAETVGTVAPAAPAAQPIDGYQIREPNL